MSAREFASTRLTFPDYVLLTENLRVAADDPATVVFIASPQLYRVKKPTDWSTAQIAAAQTAIDTTPVMTPQNQAQYEIDGWPLAVKALVLTLIDQLNVLRAFHSLPAITPAQAIQAVKNKAATL